MLGRLMHVRQEDAFPWLRAEKAFIRDWVREGRPFLGICLGRQLLAEAMGCAVGAMALPEIGVFDVALTKAGRTDPVLGDAAPLVGCLRWHHAEMTRLPPGAVVLAA